MGRAELRCAAATAQALGAAGRRPFVHAVAERLPEPAVDYVRLQIRARTLF